MLFFPPISSVLTQNPDVNMSNRGEKKGVGRGKSDDSISTPSSGIHSARWIMKQNICLRTLVEQKIKVR